MFAHPLIWFPLVTKVLDNHHDHESSKREPLSVRLLNHSPKWSQNTVVNFFAHIGFLEFNRLISGQLLEVQIQSRHHQTANRNRGISADQPLWR
jgi:hypothetical protein